MFVYSIYAYIVGLFVATHITYVIIFYFSAFLFLSLLMILFFKKINHYSHYAIIILFALLGFLIVYIHNFNIKQPMLVDSGFVTIYGQVKHIETLPNKENIILENVSYNSGLTQQNIKLTHRQKKSLNHGDIIKVTAYLFANKYKHHPNGMDVYLMSLSKEIDATGFIVGDIEIIDNFTSFSYFNFSKLLNILYQFKLKLIENIGNLNLTNTGGLIAVTLGDTSLMPNKDMAALRDSALSHLIAISGFHMGIISAFVFFLIRGSLGLMPAIAIRYNLKKIAALSTIIITIVYIALLDFPIAATRASIVIIAFMVSIMANFKTIALNSLLLAFFIMTIFNPYIIYSIGFLLSVFATFSIIIFFNDPFVQNLYKKIKNLNILYKSFFWVLTSMMLTLFIEISISPILAFGFNKIPLLGILSNTLVTPLFSFLIIPCMLIYFITPDIIGHYFINIADWAFTLVIKVAHHISGFKLSNITTPFYPDYLLIIFLFSYIFVSNLRGKLKYFLFVIVLIIPYTYWIFHKSPDIIISHNYQLIAWKINNNTYLLSTDREKFLEKSLFSNTQFNITYQNDDYLLCDATTNCIIQINGNNIAINNNNYDTQDDCIRSILIISKHINNSRCGNNTQIIDKNHMSRHGTTFIYFTNNKIKISQSY